MVVRAIINPNFVKRTVALTNLLQVIESLVSKSDLMCEKMKSFKGQKVVIKLKSILQ